MKNKALRYLAAFCFFAWPALACRCQMSLSACNEVKASDVVFIGTVESMEPKFLSRWNLASPAALRSLNEAYLNARQQPSQSGLDRLKNEYFKTFPELAEDEKERVNAAKSSDDVTSLFYLALDRGMRVRFQVRTLFKHEDDDDDKKDDKDAKDDEKEDSVLDIWTPFGDCGFDFQTGETYLVYANVEEGSDYMFTGSCTRTRRLSSAGDDLAYLFFYKEDPKRAARLEGFATTDKENQFAFDALHAPETVLSPVSGVLIELLSTTGPVLYAQPDSNGRFVFDGLPEGDYQASAFAAGFPLTRQLLAGPRRIRINEKSCAHQFLLLPK